METATRSDLYRMIAGALELLDAWGASAGQPVPALLSSRSMSVAMLVAGTLSGRPLAPLAPRLTRRELLACLDKLSAGVLVTEPEWSELAAELAEETGLRLCVVPESASGSTVLTPHNDPHDVAFIMHTSGTTGDPKQVLAREGPLAHRVDINGRLFGLEPGARLVSAALFHHVAAIGNIAVGLATGATLVMFPAFSVSAWRKLELVAPTHTMLVPSMIEQLLDADALALSSLRVIGYGASPIHPHTMRRVQALLPHVDLLQMFGQTEGSPLTALTCEDHRAAAAGREDLLTSVGRAVPGVELRIHAPGPDGAGEIWARCAHSFVVDEQGWQHTGDIGRLVDGYLYLLGRRGDKIIRGGENVFPVEVEQVLESHPEVAEAAVIGVPDPRLGETIAAFVVAARADEVPDTDRLRAYCRERLAGFKVPAQWTFVDALPRNPNGKLQRRILRWPKVPAQ